MPTQYGELKNGLRAYVTYTLTTTATTYTLTITNAGIMAPAPIASNISLAEGMYYLDVRPYPQNSYTTQEEQYRSAHTFAKGNTDRWQQVFTTAKSYNGTLDKNSYSGGNTSVGVSITLRRSTPVYQTTVSIAIPTKTKYTISYNANGGSGAPSAQTKWYGETLTLSSTRPTRTGYTFAGWATSSGGSVAYQPGGSYTANSAATLYAKWTPISVTLSYNANGGSGAPASQTKVYDTSLKLQTGIPTRTGYTFKGWATTQARANAGTVDYSAGGTYSANSTSNITLWAAWSPNPYAVTYNANGGSGAPASQTKYHGTNLTLQSGVPVKAGWLFRGWATSEENATARKNSGTAEYLPGGTYTGNEPLTLWAIWHAIYTYSINATRVGADKSSTEDANGEWVMIEVSLTSAEASGNPVTAITFTDEETTQSVSWYTTNDGSGSAISFPYQPTADTIKLYAWYQRTTASERAERYNLSAKVDDAIKTGDIKTTTLPPVFRLIDAKPPGKGIAFGKAATEDDLFECELDAVFNNSLKKINADGTEIDYEISDATIALYDQLAGGTSWRE